MDLLLSVDDAVDEVFVCIFIIGRRQELQAAIVRELLFDCNCNGMIKDMRGVDVSLNLN